MKKVSHDRQKYQLLIAAAKAVSKEMFSNRLCLELACFKCDNADHWAKNCSTSHTTSRPCPNFEHCWFDHSTFPCQGRSRTFPSSYPTGKSFRPSGSGIQGMTLPRMAIKGFMLSCMIAKG